MFLLAQTHIVFDAELPAVRRAGRSFEEATNLASL
jgi:hypothetical protein